MSDILFNLEVGASYKSRDNCTFGPLHRGKSETYPFICSRTGSSWTENGKYKVNREHEWDLVKKVEVETPIDPTTYGTTKEEELVKAPRYNAGEIECIDAIKAQLTPEEYRGFLKGTVARYVWREKHKGGKRDIKKASYYLKRLLEEME